MKELTQQEQVSIIAGDGCADVMAATAGACAYSACYSNFGSMAGTVVFGIVTAAADENCLR